MVACCAMAAEPASTVLANAAARAQVLRMVSPVQPPADMNIDSRIIQRAMLVQQVEIRRATGMVRATRPADPGTLQSGSGGP
jgi:hypothetical protein